MCNDGERPASSSESRKELQIFEISTTKLLDLNDDCFNEIFERLNVINLCSVTRACKRFQRLTESLFKRKFRNFIFSAVFADQLMSNQEARDVLHNFGCLMKSVTVPRGVFQNHDIVGRVEEDLLVDIVRHCGKNVRTLKLKYFHFTSHAVDELNQLSKKLRSLSLARCVLVVDCIFHLSDFSSLKRLKIRYTRDCSFALMDVFPALKTLELYNVSIPSECILQHFFVTHKHLEELKITHCDGISSDVFRSIGQYLTNIKKLDFVQNTTTRFESIVQFQNNILHLGELKNLYHFTVHRSLLSIGNLLVNMVTNKTPVKVLRFGYGAVNNKTIDAIRKMNNLEILEFYRTYGLVGQHLIEIVKEMTQLKELIIGWQQNITFDDLKDILRHGKQLMKLCIGSERYPLDPAMYNDILDIVKERGNGIKLTITIDSVDVQDLIPQQTISMNKNFIK